MQPKLTVKRWAMDRIVEENQNRTSSHHQHRSGDVLVINKERVKHIPRIFYRKATHGHSQRYTIICVPPENTVEVVSQDFTNFEFPVHNCIQSMPVISITIPYSKEFITFSDQI